MEETKISVVINTYNAQEHLAEVLETVKNFDEVLICDMESTDDTLTIAQQYNCRIVTFPRGKYSIVEPARDFAIHEATYPWVLVVDADELITPELHDYLYEHIKKDNPADGLRIPRKNLFMGRFMHGYYPDPNLRFFRRDVTIWPSIIHTQPKVTGIVEKLPSKRKELAIVHLADESIIQRIEKINRYTEYEIDKRSSKHYGVGAFFHRPFTRFLKCYLLKGGFRDGVPGLIYALLESVYQVIMLSKIYERRHSKTSGREK